MQNGEKESNLIKLRGGRRPGAGRPAGAPNRATRPVKELAAQYTEGSIHTLVTLRDHAESEQVRLQAANALLDRGHGRPRQDIGVDAEGPVIITVQRYTPPRSWWRGREPWRTIQWKRSSGECLFRFSSCFPSPT